MKTTLAMLVSCLICGSAFAMPAKSTLKEEAIAALKKKFANDASLVGVENNIQCGYEFNQEEEPTNLFQCVYVFDTVYDENDLTNNGASSLQFVVLGKIANKNTVIIQEVSKGSVLPSRK